MGFSSFGDGRNRRNARIHQTIDGEEGISDLVLSNIQRLVVRKSSCKEAQPNTREFAQRREARYLHYHDS